LDLFIAKLIRESFLIQNAFDNIDNYTEVNKLTGHIKIILLLYKEAKNLLDEGVIIEDIKDLEIINEILGIGKSIPNDEFYKIEVIKRNLLEDIESLKHSYSVVRQK